MTRPWHEGRLSPLDFETTSVDPDTTRIVQASCGFIGGGTVPDMVTVMADPGVEIPEGASNVHGITTERARAEGQPEREVVAAVAAVVRTAIDAGYPIVAYNARFDVTVLDRACRRHGLDVPDWSRARVVDPFVIWKWLDRFRRGPRNLAAACECYGIELGDAHDAGADALAAARVAWVQATRATYVPRSDGRDLNQYWDTIRHDIDRLHAHQVEAAAEQAVSLRAYFERKQNHEAAASVYESWPVVPCP